MLILLSPHEAAQTLVDVANLRGGPDNISVIVARVDKQSAASDAPNQLPRSASVTAPQRQLRVALWLTMVGCVVLLAWSFWFSWPLGAILGTAGFSAAAAIAVLQRLGAAAPHVEPTLGGPYGNGPYRSCDGAPGPAVSASLADLADQLQELSEKEGWPNDIDWAPIQQHHKRALHAAETAHWEEAVAEYCHVIRITMQQIREYRSSVSTESGINLE